VVASRLRPATAAKAFESGAPDGERVAIQSEDLATVLLRFDGGATGAVTVGQVCAGHKNDCWIEVAGRAASIRWAQERQNELWIGARHQANRVLAKDPSLVGPEASRYTRLPGGHQEGWADAFFNVIRDIYAAIAYPDVDVASSPALATFDDGYRSACIVDAVLRSHADGGAWTAVESA
jgi:predicted dehydrogenase